MATKLTNEHLLLQDGLVAYFDPIDNVTKQVTVEAAVRIAKVNSDMHEKLVALEVINEDGEAIGDFAPKAEPKKEVK